ncbi:2-deoxy-5-keto-D-gluconate 6-phosphate aldolase domain-containing protein [Bordetella sp. FB-8]|uniref:2-deoxy-5-keto-D-gluconate 6-phosphate aldolase domain-containing protein n=1 Tax=Bordetella sp. FB-8 TaxID=1159870 RepID=UPI0003642DD9|nr:DUF2090 domain-containing protein [Bordetella sp. FB-8]
MSDCAHRLYLLPFDHRNSYVSDLFHFGFPLDVRQQARIVDSKQVIYEGFLQAAEHAVCGRFAGVLVDEAFGAGILRDARARGYTTAVSVERSGSDEFQFEYGDDFAAHIEAVDPTFAKVLVRYNPQDDAAMNLRQLARLRMLSQYCRRTNRMLMFELLVPATAGQLQDAHDDPSVYDLTMRPPLMLAAITALQDAGVEPVVWKIEGLACREDCRSMVVAARRGGRGHVGCIVLGRGADEKKVIAWIETAAQVDGFIGFAVGRTSFHDAIADYVAGKATRKQAADRIAGQYAKWAKAFEDARKLGT